MRVTLTPRQDPVAGVGAEVGDVGGAGLVYPQRVFQQQPDHRRRPQGLRSPVSVGGRDQGARPLRSSKARKATSETPQSGLEITEATRVPTTSMSTTFRDEMLE